MAAQGVPPDIVLQVPRPQHLFAAGNAHPPPLITANLHPFLKAVGESPIGLDSWPGQENIQDDQDALRTVSEFSAMLQGPGRSAGAKPKPARKRPASRISG